MTMNDRIERSFHGVIIDVVISLGGLAIVTFDCASLLTQTKRSIFVPPYTMVSLSGPADCTTAHLLIVAPSSYLERDRRGQGRSKKGWNSIRVLTLL